MQEKVSYKDYSIGNGEYLHWLLEKVKLNVLITAASCRKTRGNNRDTPYISLSYS